MFQVLIGDISGNNQILYYPADDTYTIYDTQLSMSVGSAGEFTFKVPSTNPLQSSVAQGSIITIMRDDEEFWRGEVRNITTDFQKTIEVYCVEDLAWLADEFLWVLQYTDRTYAQMFQMWMDGYNARNGARPFEIGMITNVNESDVCLWQTNYDMSVLDAFRELIAKDTGYVRVRRVTENGTTTRYIDIVRLQDFGKVATQTIEFAENLLEFVKDMDMTNMTNVIYPFGAELEGQEVYEGLTKRLEGTTLSIGQSLQTYGRHAKTVVFDTDDLDTLNALASAYVSRYSQPQLTFELSAIDLGDITDGVEHWNLGDSVHVIATPFAVDQNVYITQMDMDIQDLSRNSIQLSSYVHTRQTLTSQTVDSADAVKKMPSKSSILEAAKNNAFQILQGTDGGYVRFVVNNDVIEKIQILNTSTEATATKKWEWGLGGLGFFEREQPSDDWTNLGLALTMNGEVVAERVTAGTLTGQTIQGATINTLANGSVNSTRSDGSTVTISGGMVDILNTDGSYLNIHHKDGHLVTIGGSRWGCFNGSAWRWFDPWELFTIVNQRPWENN